MSKEILIALLEASFKEKLGTIEKRVDREMKDLTIFDTNMKNIEKCVNECNTLTNKILDKIREKKEAEEKKKTELALKAAAVAENKPKHSRGKSMPNERNLVRNKTHGNLSTQASTSTTSTAMNKRLMKNKSSGDIMRTTNQMAADKKTTIPQNASKVDKLRSKTTVKNDSEVNIIKNDKETVKTADITPKKLAHIKKESKTDIVKGKPKIKSKTSEKKALIENKTEEIKEKEVLITEEKKEETQITESFTAIDNNINKNENNQVVVEKLNDNPLIEIPKTIEQPIVDIPTIVSQTNNKFKTIIDNWPTFFSLLAPNDQINLGQINKTTMLAFYSSLRDNLSQEQKSAEKTLSELNQKNTIDHSVLSKPFAFCKGATKAIALLNDPSYCNVFLNQVYPDKDILIVYRLFFTLMTKETDIINTKDDNVFWKKICVFFIEKSNKQIRLLIESLSTNIELNDETIFKLRRELKDCTEKLTPLFFSKLCPTTGLFIFLVKEILDYYGVIQDKKTTPARIHHNLIYLINKLKEKVKQLDTKIMLSLEE